MNIDQISLEREIRDRYLNALLNVCYYRELCSRKQRILQIISISIAILSAPTTFSLLADWKYKGIILALSSSIISILSIYLIFSGIIQKLGDLRENCSSWIALANEYHQHIIDLSVNADTIENIFQKFNSTNLFGSKIDQKRTFRINEKLQKRCYNKVKNDIKISKG